ncbi:MAG: zinc ribbon domain-containing protein [Chloroflexota bacterium]
MPVYEYACKECENRFEKMQPITADPLIECPTCGKNALRRVFHPVGVIFKGSGWYINDNRNSSNNSSATPADKGTESKPEGADKGETKSESKSETKAEAKPEAKSGSTGGDSSSSTTTTPAAPAKSSTD